MRGLRSILGGFVNSVLERNLGLTIQDVGTHGRNLWNDLERVAGGVETIFDVGANRGQTATTVASRFPNAVIHCFEPSRREFERLLKRCEDLPVIAHNVALGSSQEERTLYTGEHTTTHSLIRTRPQQSGEMCVVDTVDHVCETLGIDRLNILKIDTEGHDLDVVEGANGMFLHAGIDFVVTEVGFSRRYARLVLFDDMRARMEKHGYLLFGIYDQQVPHHGKNEVVYANACFVSPRMRERES